MEEYKKLLSPRTKLVSITAMSNVLGTLTPTKEICKLAHKSGAKVLIDGAQSAAHSPTDVQNIDCDFFTMSAHKMLGPTGVGVLYGKEELLEATAPFLFGGEMAKTVSQNDAEWNDLPWKFEAGTPNIADVIAFTKAIEFLKEIGMENIKKHDRELLDYAKSKFSQHENVTLHSPKDTAQSGGVLSFTIKGIHPHDIASIFNEEGIAIRSGQHCAEPLLKSLNLNATARISFYIYNTKDDIDRAETALKKVIEIFA
jgi:cysteine desulfurase/selenocysteine lyase